ncbi:SAM-dependent DNA methyltransferase [Moritella marina ATCC 15381]|uniref:site-specific DNA-methyltransferase (adenine-specific) n=1 Tax=Moritella marina ATCC 15381 TaxID=1202962 RepID=A0A5J6WI01_MORMI|nr:class I SAM-dependent DNA methyltransferase [Moritella marina]QFI36801.1 SAM-dependent DNA methyltransferase [Moritella marina ATCC 15381]
MLTGKIRNQIDQVWEMFWTGGVANPISVIEQISYLLFIRRLDELQKTAERRSQATGLPLNNTTFSPDEQALRWSSFKDKDPDVMMEIVRDRVFPKIKNLHDKGSFAEHMKDAIFMIPSSKLLSQVVDLLSAIDMNDKDTKGDLYEYLLSKLQQSGVNGQFRTPRNIIQMMVELMQPKVGDTICDPSSGTCGFLMAALEYVEQHHQNEINKPDNRKHFNNEMFTGFDFDKSMLRIGAMNMLLHGIENPSVHYRDSLRDQGDDNISEAYNLILANPPFKGAVDFDIISPDLLRALGKTPLNKSAVVKTKTELDENGNEIQVDVKKKGPTEKSEVLFLALILRMLTVGGRAAVIIPDGVLFGSTKAHKTIRKKIIEEQKLEAVISLPSGVFKPYAGVSTAILIFTKTNSGGTDNVWFYDMQADGYSLDDKRTKLFKEDEKPTHQQSNIADIIARFNTLTDENGLFNNDSPELNRNKSEQSFMVSLADLKADEVIEKLSALRAKDKQAAKDAAAKAEEEGKKPKAYKDKSYSTFVGEDGTEYVITQESAYDLSLNRYKEVIYEEVQYDAPKDILKRIKTLQDKMAKGVVELEGLLK